MSFENPATAELERMKGQRPRGKKNPSTADQLDEGPLAAEPRVHLVGMNGKEIAACCSNFEKVCVKRFGKQPKLYLGCAVLDNDYPELEGTKLFAPCQLPPEGKNPKSYPDSKFYDWWTIANEGKPMAGERMSFKRFLGSVFQVRLHTVSHDSKKNLKPIELHYTIISDIVGLHARGTKSW